MHKASTDRTDDEFRANGTKVPIHRATPLNQVNLTAYAQFAVLLRGRHVTRLAGRQRTALHFRRPGTG